MTLLEVLCENKGFYEFGSFSWKGLSYFHFPSLLSLYRQDCHMLTRVLTALSHIARPIFPTPSKINYLRVIPSKPTMVVANKQATGWTLLEGRNSRLRPWVIATAAFVGPRFLCAAALSGHSLNIPDNGILMACVVTRHTTLDVDTRLVSFFEVSLTLLPSARSTSFVLCYRQTFL